MKPTQLARIACRSAALAFLLATGVAQAQQAPVNPLHLSFHHVTASVANLELEASWYERVLGFERSPLLGGDTDFKAYHMTLPGYRIDLVQQKGSARHRVAKGPFEQGWLHIVFKTHDLRTTYQYLLDEKTDVTTTRDEKGNPTHLSLHDPEGNEIGIAAE